jgi:hypothetical protein
MGFNLIDFGKNGHYCKSCSAWICKYPELFRSGEETVFLEAIMTDSINSNIEIEARFLACGDSWRGNEKIPGWLCPHPMINGGLFL